MKPILRMKSHAIHLAEDGHLGFKITLEATGDVSLKMTKGETLTLYSMATAGKKHSVRKDRK